ncbi:hypothetical protein NVP2275O_247 [Vibrio phage 2.275.O._10N.286.54.E11]|nr:hypothetical protein NVP2275O_247 [Vibrio phage 2.275.O._10N.286.54.E11]
MEKRQFVHDLSEDAFAEYLSSFKHPYSRGIQGQLNFEKHVNKLGWSFPEDYFYDAGYKKLSLICPKNHVREMKPQDFIKTKDCSLCSGMQKEGAEENIIKLFESEGYKKDTSFEYINNHTKLDLVCPVGHSTRILPHRFRTGTRCDICTGFNRDLTRQKFYDILDNIGYIIEGEFEYNNGKSRVKLICNEGHKFESCPEDIKRDVRCSVCYMPKGEREVLAYLEKNNIEYRTQQTFDDCVYRSKLRFDFSIIINGEMRLIEYNGEQHYHCRGLFDNEEAFKIQQIKDNIKRDYCKKHNIPLLEIKYTEFRNINLILEGFIK